MCVQLSVSVHAREHNSLGTIYPATLISDNDNSSGSSSVMDKRKWNGLGIRGTWGKRNAGYWVVNPSELGIPSYNLK